MAFEGLSEKLNSVFKGLRGKGGMSRMHGFGRKKRFK